MQGLADMRVVDFSSWIAGPYVSKLFADAGAEVIKIEGEGGDPMRRWSSSQAGTYDGQCDSAFFQYLNASKRSLQGQSDDAEVLALIESADLLIEDFQAGSAELEALDVDGLRERFPHLVILSISPYGRSGPFANRPATEFTVQAESGSVSIRGLNGQPPFMAGGKTTYFLGGASAAVAALAAVRGARRSGRGEHIDFSLTECMNLGSTIYMDLMFSLMGRPEMPAPIRSVESPSIEPTRDGWVGFNTNSRQQFDDFLIMIERPDLIGDEGLASAWGRIARMDEWDEIVRAWTTQHTTEEIIEQAGLLRIPVAPVLNGQSVVEHEQFKARGVFEKNPGGDFLQPRPPYLVDGQRLTTPGPAPRLGEHNGAIVPRERPAVADPAAPADQLPLAGVRILDATGWWAGPLATQTLAGLGADVIHLESVQRLDGARTVIAVAAGEQWWEKGHLFNGTNTNKRSLTLDLNQPRGLALMKSLIAECDIVVENFSPRVFEHFGLDADSVRKLNPNAVFARLPAFGLDGPWRDRVGFAQTMEQMSGLAWLTGHVEDQCRIQRGPCDPLAGMHAAFAMLVGLFQRDTSGKGAFLECTMVEAALNAAAEQVVEYSAYGRLLEREGNRSPYCAPQGLYACEGEDNWLALSIASDAQWQALVDVMDRPAWAMDPRFATHAGRRAAHDDIDRELTSWAERFELHGLVDSLLASGVPAAALLDSQSAFKHPQMAARGFFETVDHPVAGSHLMPGLPFRFASRDGRPWLHQPAPTLGQHNRELLSELLGLGGDELAELEQAQVIGSQPLGL